MFESIMPRTAKKDADQGNVQTGRQAIAYRLKLTREALGLIPAELCRRTGIGTNAWSQYESGDRRISLEAALKLCEEFQLTLDWIYRGDPSGLPYSLGKKLVELGIQPALRAS